MKNQFIYITIFFYILFSCCSHHKPNYSLVTTPKVLETKGYVVPNDSMAIPIEIPIGKPKKIFAGNHKIIYTNTNIHNVGIPKVEIVDEPKIVTPGQDSFSLPKTILVINRPFLAGIPEVVAAKDAKIKDINPQNFSSFSILQGLPGVEVSSLLQDKEGNLWFGTLGGGASKYDGRSFTNFNEKNGLCNNFVMAMLQDKEGNIWFATNGGGITKYDGKYFTNFSIKEGLPSNQIPCIFEDRAGNIWIGTWGKGALKYDGKTFTNFTKKEGLCSNSIQIITQDKAGNIWFGSLNENVSKYDGRSFVNFTEIKSLSGKSIMSIIEDEGGSIWFGTYGGGLVKLTTSSENGKNKYAFTQFTEKEGLSKNAVFSILQDKRGDFWIGTYGGGISKLTCSETKGLKKYSFINFNEKDGLSSNYISSILQDKSGNLWFGTYGGGASKFGGDCFTFFTKNEGLVNNTVRSIFQDKSGNLWFGTYNGGVSKYDGKSFTNYTTEEGLGNNFVFSILEDNDGNIWLGTFDGVSKFDGKYFSNYTSKEGISSTYSMMQDNRGNIWFGTLKGAIKYNGKTIVTFTKKEGLSNNYVYSILQDNRGDIWFGTYGGGVTKLSINDKEGYDKYTFTHFTEKEGLSKNIVFSTCQDKNKSFWFGTLGGGVTKFIPIELESSSKYAVTYFTEKDGISNTIYSILQDSREDIWLGTSSGLSKQCSKNLANTPIDSAGIENRVYQQPFLFKNYSYEDGFLGIICGLGAIYEDKSGIVWVGTNDKLTAYHHGGDEMDTIAPNIQLTAIELFNENIPWVNIEQHRDTNITLINGVVISDLKFDETSKWYGLPKNLSLKYNNNFLTFKYIGITQKQSKKVKYQYMLEGLDESWCAPTFRNEAVYGNLPHGIYTFRVKAMNSEGYWSNAYTYTFSIRPPWWKTLWFMVLIASFITFCLFGFFRWRVESLRRQKKQLELIVKEKTAEVVEQKNELQLYNEELTATNEELFNQREELDSTLHSLKEAQRQLIQSEKMASLGVLASGIVHEVNNPLNYIQGGIDGIKQYFNENLAEHKPNVEFYIDGISEGVKRAADILSGLNYFSRSGNFISDKIDIHAIIDNCLLIFHNKTNNKIEIVKKYTNKPFTLSGNEGNLHQAILNVLANAVQAIEDKGCISISTEIDGGKITITITDNGCGISEENISKVFEPFFTTKDVGQGTGLGLSITYNIIKEHNGTIEFESELGKGTATIITLPLFNAGNDNK